MVSPPLQTKAKKERMIADLKRIESSYKKGIESPRKNSGALFDCADKWKSDHEAASFRRNAGNGGYGR